MDNLLILTTRKLNSAPRVLREIDAFSGIFNIWAVGHSAPNNDSVNFIDIETVRQSFAEKFINIGKRVIRRKSPLIKWLSRRHANIEALVKKIDPKCVITHEPHFLPYLVFLKKKYGFKIIYNAHEYHPLEFSDNTYWNLVWRPYYENVYRGCLPHVDLFINVCESIAEKCREEFGKDSLAIPNASDYHDLQPVDNSAADVIKMVHHGGCLPGRKIEEMIEVARLLGKGYRLDLMLTFSEGKYFEKVKIMAKEAGNVSIVEPVTFKQIVPFTNTYDIGLYILPPTNYNNSVGLPNKFFEFMQARLAVAIGPSIEMMRYVNKYELGVVSEDFSAESLVKKIRILTREQINAYKRNADLAAKELSAEKFNQIFKEAVENLK